MTSASSGVQGIDIRYGKLAWVENTRVKVIQVVRDWDGRTIDLAGIQELFQTINSYEEILAVFTYYLRNKEFCDEQIRSGKDTPVFNFWVERDRYNAYMTPLQSGYLLLKGSLIADSLSRKGRRYVADRRRLAEEGFLERNRVVRDIPFSASDRTKMSSIVTCHPNSGCDRKTNAKWLVVHGPFRGQTLSQWEGQTQLVSSCENTCI